MEKTNNNILQTSDLQVVVVESEPRFRAQVKVCHPVICRKDRKGLCRSEVSGSSSFREEGTLLFLPLYSEDKQYEVRWLFKPTNATWATSRGGRKVQRSAYVGPFTPSCGDSCGTSRWQLLRTGTKGPRRSTRYAPLCGGRGWCGSAGPPGLTTPWVGSFAGRGCRSWSTPICWPSEGFPARTATEKSRNMWCTVFVLFL